MLEPEQENIYEINEIVEMYPEHKIITHINDTSQPAVVKMIDWQAAVRDTDKQNTFLL